MFQLWKDNQDIELRVKIIMEQCAQNDLFILKNLHAYICTLKHGTLDSRHINIKL